MLADPRHPRLALLLHSYFLSVSNFLNILLATSVIGVLAYGATFVIAAPASISRLARCWGSRRGRGARSLNALGPPWPIGILACLLTGAVLRRRINGPPLHVAPGTQSFIVMLGMLVFAAASRRPPYERRAGLWPRPHRSHRLLRPRAGPARDSDAVTIFSSSAP